MGEIAEVLRGLGNASLEIYWLPVALWSGLALLVYGLLKIRRQANIEYQYHGRAALLLALPVGVTASYLTSRIQQAMNASQSELSAKFIVLESPIDLPAVTASAAAGPASGAEWGDPMIWIGLLVAVIALISLQQVLLLALNFIGLRGFARSLDSHPLSSHFRPQLEELRCARRVRIAYSSRIEVPFTFGCFRPVIVLPKRLRGQRVKRRMSIRHELTHIKHGDYAMNALLLLSKALFWFHPLVHTLQSEAQRYREISCDREVLSHAAISRKEYARLLLELAPKRLYQPKASVGMSVHPNTLKERIQIMKTHKTSSSPLRSHIILALITAFFVTGIMACTDLQRSDATGEALLGQQLSFKEATIAVNGVPFVGEEEPSPRLSLSGPANGVIALTLGKYGTFLLSGQKFGEAEAAATVEGRTMTLARNGLEVVIRSDVPIVESGNVTLWVDHDPEFAITTPDDIPVIQTHIATSHEEYLQFREEQKARMEGNVNMEADLNLEGDLEAGGRQQDPSGQDFFVAVEDHPELIGGLQALQAQIDYPERARRAGIEGQVIVQFIVNENGNVEDTEVIRGVHPLLDEAAMEGIRRHAEFRPGKQRGQPVRVQFSLPIVFRLNGGSGAPPPPVPDEDTSPGTRAAADSPDREPPPAPVPPADTLSSDEKIRQAEEAFRQLRNEGDLPTVEVRDLETGGGTVSGRVVDARSGDPVPVANVVVVEQQRGSATSREGEFSISGLEPGSYTLRVTFVGYQPLEQSLRIDN